MENQRHMRNLPYTGERLVPSELNETAVEHLARYALCLPLVKNKKVLDIACGEGYGSSLLADQASSVTGMDIDSATINHASGKYRKKNLQFRKGSILQLPFEKEFDVIVCLETLEHLEEHDMVLWEIKKALIPGGILILSTPNKEQYSIEKRYRNPFHVKELYHSEFDTLLRKHFAFYQVFMQASFFGSIIFPAGEAKSIRQNTGNYESIDTINAREKAEYFIALASDQPLPSPEVVCFDGNNIFELARLKLEQSYRSTLTYRIGHLITGPFKWLRKVLFKKSAS